jgi:hypothetical protein
MAETVHTKSLPCTVFDHVVWLVQTPDGSWRRAAIPLGECVLLFTSLDAANDFINGVDEAEGISLNAAVFSRSRKDFGRQARMAARLGVIGALFDPNPQTGVAPFLRFGKHAE